MWGDERIIYEIVPLADGGDGTVAAFLESGAIAQRATVRGPLGDRVEATYARDGDTAIVEMATASGLALLGDRRNPLHASTYGTGELIRFALDGGAQRIVLGIGGSATTDGGAGALAALGVRFFDDARALLRAHPAGLANLAAIDVAQLDARLARVPISIACDVTNPLTGPHGAAAAYGPQKGASRDDIERLDAFLTRFADIAKTVTQKDLRSLPGSGAAGGIGWGLATFANATLAHGFTIVAELRGFANALRGASLCITGEGRIDRQSASGKVLDGVATMAASAGVDVVAFAGSVERDAEALFSARGVTCLPIVVGPMDVSNAMKQAPQLIRDAAARFARLRPAPV